ncbi:gamma-glutamylcyclotransferase family protein [Antrihabitans cavernicola]|uniref:Gamma-glutamylcyclotransferase n=1 Tax=Antrihabitans cavernicola TaxID=2495913 RepID=A0A5A7S8C1_9NOCA|nr:gamma-glutamylcyclotransferase family protein [Spelaeibacter cavernicola]KAA0022380.1 gamma-glutamylcyclotransferase [Spelaeibacter cavernicola]
MLPQHLFSYGTLQDPAVQLGTFGRYLGGRADELAGHRIDMLTITDPHVLALSGIAQHPIVVPSDDPDDAVSGTVFQISAAELRAADEYEVDDYERIEVTLASGTTAWVYQYTSRT